MQVDENNINEVLKNIEVETYFLHDYGNGIFLNDKQTDILDRYGFDYKKYNSINSLLFDIEEYLNDDYDGDNDELEWVSSQLSENNYYQNTKK